jgi:hypothetical protein
MVNGLLSGWVEDDQMDEFVSCVVEDDDEAGDCDSREGDWIDWKKSTILRLAFMAIEVDNNISLAV